MSAINVIFDGPPGPVAGRFIEAEDDSGQGIKAGEWTERPDGSWALRIKVDSMADYVAELLSERCPHGYLSVLACPRCIPECVAANR